MKTLETIQKISSLGRILSRVAYIVSIVGFLICIAALAALCLNADDVMKIGGVTLHSVLSDKAGVENNGIAAVIIWWMTVLIGEAVTARFSVLYFSHEIEDGTPFTRSSSEELMRLGIITIAVPLASLVAAAIVTGIISAVLDTENVSELVAYEADGNIVLGVMFIIGSLLCRHGAEIREEKY